jgi:mono/diheme cytochrome c family protein
VTVRTWLLIINVVVLVGLVAYAIVSIRRSPEAKAPENLTPFLGDEDLEGRRLERVLGWALLFAAVIAVALPLYWLREPTRQKQSVAYYQNGSIARGATLFANSTMPAYLATASLQCANCHGSDGGGGSVKTTYDPDGDGPLPAIQVTWSAPPLNTELLRFSPDEITQIITYGRPGTPMQAWGVEGGGPKNDQSIQDLVNYIQSIQLTPAKAQAKAAQLLADAKSQPQDAVKAAEDALKQSQSALTTAQQDQTKTDNDPKASAKDKADAQAAVTYAENAIANNQQSLAWAQAWAKFRANVTDGQLLFEINCARCHTKGWSVFDPTQIEGTEILGPPGGGGTIGPNLRGGVEARRFATPQMQADFVGTGSDFEKQFGNGGIGTGRMPGFNQMLTKQMINEIVEYERNVIDSTNYNVPFNGKVSGSQTGTGTVPTTLFTSPATG